MPTKLLHIGALLLAIFGSPSWAYEYASPLEFNHIELANLTDDQTNVGAITAITQDQRGFMWIGGENGLARYDGHNVLVYRADPKGMVGTYIQGLTSDGSQYLWIGSTAGLSRLNYQTGRFDNLTETSQQIPGNNVTSISLYKDWALVGTTSGLAVINRHSLKTEQPSFLRQLPKKLHLRATYVYRDTLWLGTSNQGLIEIDLNSQTTTFYSPKSNDPSAIPNPDIRGIITFDGNRFWLASLGGGFIEFNRKERRFTQYAALESANHAFVTNDVFGIFGDSKGNVWIGTDNSGLWRFNPTTNKLDGFIHDKNIANGLSSDKTRFIFEDRDFNLWVGCFSGAVEFHNNSLDQFTRLYERNRFHSGLNHASVLSIEAADNNRYWVGTESGLDLVDAKQGSVKSYRQHANPHLGLVASPVLAIGKDDIGNLWLGTWGGGLQKFNPKTEQWSPLISHPDARKRLDNSYIWALQNDGKGNMWVGTQKEGVYRVQLATDDVFHYPYNSTQPGAIFGEFILDMTLDSHGQLWVSSLSGVYRYRPESDDFEVFKNDPQNPNSLNTNQTTALLARENGDIWIGTQSAGINIYHADQQRFSQIGAQQGLMSTEITSLLEDDQGHVWAATAVGVFRIDEKKQKVTHVTQVNGLAGTNHNRNASAFSATGDIWLGSKSGLSIFNPRLIEPKTTDNKVEIAGVSINYGPKNGDIYWQSSAYLPAPLTYNQNAISIDFSLNTFYFSRLNEYRYRLVGLSDQWQKMTRNNTATYTNLDPGSYTFEVTGKSANGQWSELTTQLRFIITPPLWRQWWAYIIYAALLTLVLIAFRHYLAVHARGQAYKQLSQRDALTQLPNRLALNAIVEKWNMRQTGFGLIVLDLDFFKKINDNHGHNAGDALLKDFAILAESLTREQDIMGRWGGEEFLILCCRSDLITTQNIALRIQKTVANHHFSYNGITLPLTISAGCAIKQENESFNSLFQRADQALYYAKDSGRNCVKVS
ncbi:MAG: diguanylate cyclase [Marinagarivorans sp.]|nr:diguanylate cyclase [Marinagarivorans sp.]